MSKLYDFFKSFKTLLNPHPVVLMPEEIKKPQTIYIVATIFSTGVLDLISMAVKGSTFAIAHGWNYLAFILLIAYYLRQCFNYTNKTVLEEQWQNIYAKSDDYINSNIIRVSNAVRGKVYSKTSNGSMEVMQNSEIIFQMHAYIRIIWDFWKTLPVTISSTITLLFLSGSMLYLEWIDTASGQTTSILFVLLLMCIIFYIFIARKKIKVHDKYRQEYQLLKKKSEKIKDTLKNIEPICTEEFEYRAQNFLDVLAKIHAIEKEMFTRFNKLTTYRAIAVAFFMCTILCIKVFSSGGISAISDTLIAEIIAIGAIYEAVLEKLDVILKNIEFIINSYKDLKTYSPDFKNILETYNQVANVKFETADVEEVTVNPMQAEYPKKESAYKLIVDFLFKLKKGYCYLFFGPTGCGKSTLIHIICGKLILKHSPISYGVSSIRGYLASLLHETNGKLGTEFVLNEIIFSNNQEDVCKEKLLEILRGLNLYENIKTNLGIHEDNEETERKVIHYLASTNIEEYSAGQKQRLAIAKLLYNLKTTHQIIAFDEATNALDSETTIKVLHFIKNYCMRDTPRILIFASHQIAEMMTIIDEAYTFDQTDSPTSRLVRVK